MERDAILSWFEGRLVRDIPLTIPDEIFGAMTPEVARGVVERHGSYGLIRLPDREQRFFEWLRTTDPLVWQDLWGDAEEPYVVSVAFLESLLDDRCGFPICDLMSTDNYYFFPAMLEWTPEARDYTEAVRGRLLAGEKLTTEQLLVAELALGGATDIWHFAYRHHIPVDEVKDAVRLLVEDKVLVHLRSAEQLAPFLR